MVLKYVKREDVFAVALVVFAFLESLSKFRGVGVSDAGDYVYAAHDLCLGHIPITENFYANRIGTVAPFALGMKIFGLNALQLTYVSTFIFLLLQIFVYKIVSLHSKVVALFTIALLSLSNIMLASATAVMGDITITLMANAPVLVYYWFSNSWNRGLHNRAKLFGIAAGILFVAAVLTKESVVFFSPLLFWLAYHDRKDGKKAFWLAMFKVVFAGALLICYWYWWMTGNPLYRLSAVNAGCSQSDCNYANAPWWMILERISFQPAQFLVQDYGFGLLAFLSLLNLCRKSPTAEVHFFKIYLLFTLGMWWVGPQGLPWNPVALVHRLWLPIMVPLAINAALILSDIVFGKLTDVEKRRLSGVAVAFLIVTAFLLYHLRKAYIAINEPQDFLQMGAAYTFAVIAVIASLLMKDGAVPDYLPNPKKLLLPVIILSLVGYQGLQSTAAVVTEMLHLTTGGGIDQGAEYRDEQAIVLYTEAQHPVCILTDYNLSCMYHVYDGFVQDYPFKAWDDVSVGKIPQSAYLIINKGRLDMARRQITETLIYTQLNGTDRNPIVPAYAYKPQQYGFVLVKATATHEVWEKVKGRE